MIAINDAFTLAPWADVLFAADHGWWRWHEGAPSFAGLKYALHMGASAWPGVTVLRNTGINGLELDPRGLRAGYNGGYQAMNLAVHLGASRIVLLGYDMQAPRRGPSHFFGEHPNQCRSSYGTFREAFPSIIAPLQALGISVVNATRETALECFPRMTLAEALS